MKYRAYHKQIAGNVIAYIADRYFQKTGHLIEQSELSKMLALFDFTCVREIGRPCTELEFKAGKDEPVAQELQ